MQYEDEKQDGMELPAGTMPQPGEDFFRYRIESLDILDNIQHQLKGEVYDPEVGKYVKKFDPWLNDDGINKFSYVIYSCGINKNILLGNLSADQINFKCKLLKKKLSRLITFPAELKQYDVDKKTRSLLIATVVNPIHSALSRSEEGREADQLSTGAQRHEVFQYQQQPEKRGILGALSFGRGRGN